MRRVLVLMRHGEAVESAPGGDSQRPLTAEGRADAAATARALTRLGLSPQVAWTSDAVRTRQTAAALAGESWAKSLSFEPRADLYLTGWSQVRALLAPLPDDVTTVLIIGHNPGFSDAASGLVGGGLGLRPAEAAVVACEASSWAEAVGLAGAWTLLEHVRA